MFSLKIFLNWSLIALHSCVAFCCISTWISYKYTYVSSLLSLPPTPLGHHRAPSWALCAMQQLPTSYLLYTWWCIYVSPTLSICPTLSFLHCVHKPFSRSASLFHLLCLACYQSSTLCRGSSYRLSDGVIGNSLDAKEKQRNSIVTGHPQPKQIISSNSTGNQSPN